MINKVMLKYVKLYENWTGQDFPNDLLKRVILSMQKGDSEVKIERMLDTLNAETVRSGGPLERDLVFNTLLDLCDDDPTYIKWKGLISAYLNPSKFQELRKFRHISSMSQDEIQAEIDKALEDGNFDLVKTLSKSLK